jgi:hypothetical protein
MGAKNLIKETVGKVSVFSSEHKIKKRYQRLLKNTMKEPLAPLPPGMSSSEIRDYWKRFGAEVDPRWAQYYFTMNGIASPAYIPSDLWFKRILTKLNQIDRFGFPMLQDKNYLDMLFSEYITCPAVYARCINGQLLDASFRSVTMDQALDLCMDKGEVVVKQSIFTNGGENITFLAQQESQEAFRAKLAEVLKKHGKNFVVQGVLKQHPDMAALNPDSINSIRVLSLLWDGEVKIAGALVRIGVKGVRVDNPHTSNGLSCVILGDGKLNKYAYDRDWYPHTELPGGLVLEGYRIPSYDKIVERVKQMHLRVPHTRFLGWDITVSESGEPLLIEANLRAPEIYFHQIGAGPLIQDEKLLKEIMDATR